MSTQSLEVSDFSFGITDYYRDGGDARAQKTLDNLELDPNKKPSTRWGSEVVGLQLPLGTARVSKILSLADSLIAFQGKRAYSHASGTWVEVAGPSGGNFFPSGDVESVIMGAEWRGHLYATNDSYTSPQKYFLDDSGTRKVRNAGLPEIPAGFSVAAASGTGHDYLYAACFVYVYKVGSVTFEDRGPVFTYLTKVSGGVISAANKATVSLPTALVANENWDVANIKIELYRTKDVSDVFYYLASVPLGTSSYLDGKEDVSLILPLYTTGGVADNGTPPKAKYLHIINDYGLYANIKTGTEVDETLIIQSKSGDPDSVDPSFYARVDQPIRGISSIFDRPVVLCSRYVYRLDGAFLDDGSGGIVPKKIDDKAGCVSALSVVQTPLGLFWAGQDGFYWTDGLTVAPISNHLNLTYKLLVANETKRKNIQATFDSAHQRIYWTASKDSASECDVLFTLDLKFQVEEAGKLRGSFRTWSGASFAPSSFMFIDGKLYRGDRRGYVLEHREGVFTDPRIEPGISTAFWQQETIMHTYESCFMDFGSKSFRKHVPKLFISARNDTNLSLAISSSNDNNRVVGELQPVRYNGNIVWGAPLPYWGDPTVQWNKQGIIEEMRRFPAGSMRCNYKQVILRNAKTEIIDSDVLGLVTVNAAGKTATLNGTKKWLSGIVDYFIKFEHDGYVNEFKILAQTLTTVTYEDPSLLAPAFNGNYKFLIVGYPKGQVFSLNSYVIHWSPISSGQTPFSSSSLGGNPT